MPPLADLLSPDQMRTARTGTREEKLALIDSFDPTKRQQILRALGRLSELTPDVRFGQLIANLSYLALGPTNEAIWDMEDEELLQALEQHYQDLSARGARVSSSHAK